MDTLYILEPLILQCFWHRGALANKFGSGKWLAITLDGDGQQHDLSCKNDGVLERNMMHVAAQRRSAFGFDPIADLRVEHASRSAGAVCGRRPGKQFIGGCMGCR